MPTSFYYGTDWQQSSSPHIIRQVAEGDVWPVDDNSDSGAKDNLLTGGVYNPALHPVVAIGGRTAADGRPLNFTGIVTDVTPSATQAESLVRVNVADGAIVRNYVANVLSYSGTVATTFETAPVPGQPVYVDDSEALTAGVTLSMSPLSGQGLKNPQAGVLFYCQDEYPNDMVGGPNAAATFDTSLSNSLVEQVYCVMLNGSPSRDLADAE